MFLISRQNTDDFLKPFYGFLSAVALPFVTKVEFNFDVIVFLFSKVRETTLNPRSILKTYLKAYNRSSCFRGGGRKKNIFTRTVWGLCTHWSSILRPPKHWFVFLRMKTRPLKFALEEDRNIPGKWYYLMRNKNLANEEINTTLRLQNMALTPSIMRSLCLEMFRHTLSRRLCGTILIDLPQKLWVNG